MNEFGYAFSAQLRGAGQISSGKTLTATGLAMFLASKEPDFAATEWSQRGLNLLRARRLPYCMMVSVDT